MRLSVLCLIAFDGHTFDLCVSICLSVYRSCHLEKCKHSTELSTEVTAVHLVCVYHLAVVFHLINHFIRIASAYAPSLSKDKIQVVKIEMDKKKLLSHLNKLLKISFAILFKLKHFLVRYLKCCR